MSEPFIPTDHEHFQINRGPRSDLPVMIAIHSTALGPAVASVRISAYDHASAGMADCLLLSKATTITAAAVDNGTGGGKAVVSLPRKLHLTKRLRNAILLDVADQVHALNGVLIVAPDVDTGPDDIEVIYRRTPHVIGLSKAKGHLTYGTSIGVESAIRAAARQTLGVQTLEGLTFCIFGVNCIGLLLAETFSREGVQLVLSDVDETKREIAVALGARWQSVEDALCVACDVLIPCAVGGLFTIETAKWLDCKIICGAATGQLASEEVARDLTDRSITYVPYFIANAGGLMYASGIELHHLTEDAAERRVRESIAKNVQLILKLAARSHTTTYEATLRLAYDRLAGVMRSKG